MKIETWYNKVGFYSNPFSIKPAAFSDELFGFEEAVDQLIEDIGNGSFYLITGTYGNGKTTLLKRIVNNLRGRRVIYHNYLKSNSNIDFEELFTGMSFMRSLFGVMRKDNILLLDEAKHISEDDLKKINELSEKGYIKSAIFVSPDDKIELIAEINEKIGNNRIGLNSIKEEAAISLIRKRIGELKLLPDTAIAKIFKMDKNPRNFLRNCEDVCKYAVDNGIKKVNEKIIKKALE
jgi:energy-coupling factor transporter ATP-binding protein EcfA2